MILPEREKKKSLKVACASLPSRLDDLAFNLALMEGTLREASGQGADLLLFGEAFLQGFEAFSFRYQEDIHKALFIRSPEITRIRHWAREAGTGLAFGFLENEAGGLYSSYLIVDKEGNLAGHYRRVSKGWKKKEASADYREGKTFIRLSFEGWSLTPLVCGDFWEDDLLTPIVAQDPETDLFLWPVHCDYNQVQWDESENQAYRERTEILAKPILFVNNYIDEANRAKGGVYLWHQGKEIDSLPYGKPGIKYLTIRSK